MRKVESLLIVLDSGLWSNPQPETDSRLIQFCFVLPAALGLALWCQLLHLRLDLNLLILILVGDVAVSKPHLSVVTRGTGNTRLCIRPIVVQYNPYPWHPHPLASDHVSCTYSPNPDLRTLTIITISPVHISIIPV